MTTRVTRGKPNVAPPAAPAPADGQGGHGPVRNRSNPAVKAKRQRAILSLVSRERLSSQEEIRARLQGLGLRVTQSTISRDIEELGLARIHAHDGPRYVVPGEGAAPVAMGMLRHLMEEFALSFTAANNILVIRTPPGAANALAEGLDRVGLADVAGTIAGDNTILVVAREGVTAKKLQRNLEQLMEATS